MKVKRRKIKIHHIVYVMDILVKTNSNNAEFDIMFIYMVKYHSTSDNGFDLRRK